MDINNPYLKYYTDEVVYLWMKACLEGYTYKYEEREVVIC